ncbi:MAG: hypothetical protein QOH13_1469 [Thermoleophilaceae bacterium]|nr:hypothetical protein [Thermoleophilaceae bacterium]
MPRIAVLAALVASLALAACGSSSDSKPTKAEYITKADAICKKADTEINAQAQKQFGNKAPTDAQVTTFTHDVVLPKIEKESSDLKALDKPKGDDAQLNALFASLDKSINTAKSTDGTLDNSTFADANTKAKAYGLKVCGQSN